MLKMPVSQYSISWDSYKQSVSNGLSQLQRDGEFVDMTLAAEGHLVRVHQNLIALTSPYLKAMLQSASCKHPVIFLNNVDSTTLGYILEYIYTGEVRVPEDKISVFVDACRALHISGIKHFVIPRKPVVQQRVNLEVQPEIQPSEQPDVHSELLQEVQSKLQQDIYSKVLPELHADIHSEVQPGIHLEVQPDIHSEVRLDIHSEDLPEVQPDIHSEVRLDIHSEDLPEVQPDIHSEVMCQALPDINSEVLSEVQPDIHSEVNSQAHPDIHSVDLPEVQPDIHSEVMCQALPDINSEVLSEVQPDIHSEVMSQAQPEVHPLVSLLRPLESQTEREMDLAENNFAAHITINSQNYNLEISTMNNNIAQLPVITDAVMNTENTLENNASMPIISVPMDNTQTDFDLQIQPAVIPLEDYQSHFMTTNKNYSTNVDNQNVVTNLSGKKVIPKKPKPVLKFPKPGEGDRDQVFYTISNRGSIQLILNRYIYCCHHQSKGGRLRRWRCINYRQVQCRAIIDTDYDKVIHRSEYHCHSNHDNKILKKYKSKSVYTSISEATDAETLYAVKAKRISPELWKPRTNNRLKKKNNCPESMDLDGTDCND